MTDDVGGHERCIGGCMLQSPKYALAARESKYKLGSGQLERLLQLLEGRCMVCLSCHAMYVDTTTRATERSPRGMLCRFCKQRVAIYEGAYGEHAPFYSPCRCRAANTPEWCLRITAATAQYLVRTADVESCPTNEQWFACLINDVSANGPDPQRIWGGAPLYSLPRLPVRGGAPIAPDFGAHPPLTRIRCQTECRDHVEHIYIACFDEPTTLRDADTHSSVKHYVGWTRQQPPERRVSQHGAICRQSLVAIIPGTEREEELLKNEGRCPRCDHPLEYR
ncbi:MAG: hypothetical protein JWN03_4984 [Nocardia sp.]|uniref:hypothetical protein n=1 Tax=Nocardia sp. TaxID=1821 RepID=UPI002630788D|nr:hypothetical protein [Nocardia sp.]MCU1644709.1 hypothetical protein [Nocardia sp.]